MALTDENNMVMPVSPMYGGGNGGFGNSFGGDWGWIILLLLIAGNGWGGFGFGGFGGGVGGFAADGAMLYPWMNQAEITSGGFRDQMINNNITSVRDSIGNLATQVSNGFSDTQLGIAGINQNICQTGNGITSAVNNGFSQAEIAANSRQMANMNQAFGMQNAMMQGFNQLGSQFADCCCENRLGLADLKYTVATEACADRTAVGDALQNVTMQGVNNTNAIVNAVNSGVQSIKDQLCEYRNDQKDETIANLRQELMYSRGQASQVEQTAQILANNNAQTALFQQGLNNEVDALYNRLNTCPVPTTPVYGRTPIFTCGNNGNAGCGCGNF